MKRTLVVIGAAAITAAALAACGHDHGPSGTVTPPPTSQALSTIQVYGLAIHPSEVSAPIAVNDGAVTITDTSETSAPISVNGN
jgi:hypothetical protein